MIKFLTIIVCVCATVFGSSNLRKFPDARIVGGAPIDITQVPWQVSIQTPSGFHFCGGSIISPEWIVTSAHCLDGDAASDIFVGVGNSKITNMQRISAAKILINKNFDRYNHSADIGLIKLSSPLSYSDSIKAVNLPSSGQSIKDDTQVIVTGWGDTYNGIPVQLQGVTVYTVNQEKCNNAYQGGIDNTMLCAEDNQGGKGACFGDSGGPLFSIDATLLGIVSWGAGCGEKGFPAVYSRVPVFRDWIKQNTGV